MQPDPLMTRIQRRLLREDVYKEVFDRIVRGGLAPGSRVRDTAIALEGLALGLSEPPTPERIRRLDEINERLARVGQDARMRPAPLAAGEPTRPDGRQPRERTEAPTGMFRITGCGGG